jgi:four helix bundle protein
MYEADEAVSRPDFVRLLGGAAKELSETKFWLHVAIKKQWLAVGRLEPLMNETEQLLSIVKAMKVRTQRNTVRPKKR